MGKARWTDEEIEVLRQHFNVSSSIVLKELFPGRDIRVIYSKAYYIGLRRPVVHKRSEEEARKAKREYMAKMRLISPELFRDRQKSHRANNLDRFRAVARDYIRKRFFWRRAVKLRGPNKATSTDLALMWKNQRGRCALSGIRLTRENADLDHIVAKARGGGDEASNLRWLCHAVNMAKRDMPDDQFLAMCMDCAQWIGSRIQACEEGTL